jgi:hypothetical protein
MGTHLGLSPFAPRAAALWAEVKHVRGLTRAVSMSQESAMKALKALYVSGEH